MRPEEKCIPHEKRDQHHAGDRIPEAVVADLSPEEDRNQGEDLTQGEDRIHAEDRIQEDLCLGEELNQGDSRSRIERDQARYLVIQVIIILRVRKEMRKASAS